jgi:hypothetical protein
MNTEIWNRFTIPLWSDLDKNDEFYNRKPCLAHYTSIANIENIMRSNELWFANPLYMNDYEEMRFGIDAGLRVVYTPSRDPEGLLKSDCGYSIGARGIEPRLKFKIAPALGITASDFSMEKVVHRIILGPTTSSPLALEAFRRLLEATNRAGETRVRVHYPLSRVHLIVTDPAVTGGTRS